VQLDTVFLFDSYTTLVTRVKTYECLRSSDEHWELTVLHIGEVHNWKPKFYIKFPWFSSAIPGELCNIIKDKL